MRLIFESFGRALLDCLHWRVMVLSLLPLGLMVALALGLGYFYWDMAVGGVRAALESSVLINTLWDWLQDVGLGGFKTLLTPLIVIVAVTPLLMVLTLLVVTLMMTPPLTAWVANRRFGALERKQGASWLAGLVWSVTSTLLALLALLVSVPLWLIPPLIVVLPPLILGWLTYRVMAFDALSMYACRAEHDALVERHRLSLLGMGVLCGYLGAAPSLLWASGAAVAFVVLLPLSVWIYTLVFAGSSLWFAHFCLAALQSLRAEQAALTPKPISPAVPITHEEMVIDYANLR